jgi:DNA-binding NarL/FixJ family response regulator
MCVDDHAFLIDGLEARLSIEPDIECVGRLSSAESLVHEAIERRPDIVLLDIEMPGIDAFEAMAQLRRECPAVRVIILSAFVRDRYIDLAYRGGAWGYLTKNDPPQTILDGIRSVMRGEIVSGPAVVARTSPKLGNGSGDPSLDHATSRLDALSDRELQVLRLIARGLDRRQIAAQLSRSPMTIDNHRKSIMRKLAISNRAELVRYAIGEGLVEI